MESKINLRRQKDSYPPVLLELPKKLMITNLEEYKEEVLEPLNRLGCECNGGENLLKPPLGDIVWCLDKMDDGTEDFLVQYCRGPCPCWLRNRYDYAMYERMSTKKFMENYQ